MSQRNAKLIRQVVQVAKQSEIRQFVGKQSKIILNPIKTLTEILKRQNSLDRANTLKRLKQILMNKGSTKG